MTVKTFLMLQRISVSKINAVLFNFLFTVKNFVSTKILSSSSILTSMLKIQLCHQRNKL